MSDLGSDAGAKSLSLMAKVMEALLKLFHEIFEAWQKAPERRLQKYEVKQAKTNEEKQKAIKKLDGKTGYVNSKLLDKSGEALTVGGIYLKKEDIPRFNAICKREGLLFSTVSNQQLKKDGEEAFMMIKCRSSDLEKLRTAVDRFNDETRIMGIDDRIKEILSKGEENLTAQDHVNLQELTRQKEEMQRGYCDSLNQQMQETVIQNAFDESKLEPMSIGEALNRNTGRAIDKDQYSIIADANDPSKVIKCHGYEDKDPETGKPYTKTEYEVYHGDECLMKTHDGRFEGRPNDYWLQERDKLEAAADFSKTYYKFINEADYQRWAEHVNEQNRTELSEMEKPPESKDYGICRADAMAKLEENGAEIRDGVVYEKETGKPMSEYVKDPNLTQEQKTLAAESMTVGKQIQNYDTIESLQNHMDIANANLILAKPGTPEYETALADVESTKEQITKAYEQDAALVSERKEINAAQSVQQSEQERENEQENTTAEHGQEQQEHPDERRGERVNEENDPEQGSTEEWKGRIEDAKVTDGAKGMDVKDREVADPEKMKAPKSKPDRAD